MSTEHDTTEHDTTSSTEGFALSAGELWDEQNEKANAAMNALAATVTQREWLLITTKLDRTRQQIGSDTGLTLLAIAWVKGQREHGGASWERLLNMTDEQLQEVHGFAPGDRPEEGAGSTS